MTGSLRVPLANTVMVSPRDEVHARVEVRLAVEEERAALDFEALAEDVEVPRAKFDLALELKRVDVAEREGRHQLGRKVLSLDGEGASRVDREGDCVRLLRGRPIFAAADDHDVGMRRERLRRTTCVFAQPHREVVDDHAPLEPAGVEVRAELCSPGEPGQHRTFFANRKAAGVEGKVCASRREALERDVTGDVRDSVAVVRLEALEHDRPAFEDEDALDVVEALTKRGEGESTVAELDLAFEPRRDRRPAHVDLAMKAAVRLGDLTICNSPESADVGSWRDPYGRAHASRHLDGLLDPLAHGASSGWCAFYLGSTDTFRIGRL